MTTPPNTPQHDRSGGNDDQGWVDLRGTLDTTFDGPSGSGNGAFTLNIGTVDQARGVAIQPDGKIVVVGYTDDDVTVVRLNADGSYDTSFDGPGAGGVGTGTGNGKFTWDFGGGIDGATDVALQNDGQIVVTGAGSGDVLIFRLNKSDGSFDTSYDSDGYKKVDFGGTDRGLQMVLDHDGKAVVVGETTAGTGGDFLALRLTTGGALDTSFDSDGKQTTSFSSGQDGAWGVELDDQNRIVAAGQGDGDLDVVRYNSDGSLDTTFDGPTGTGNGLVRIDVNSSDDGEDVAIDPFGRILVCGSASTKTEFAIVRLKTDGTLDTAFDSDGKQTVNFSAVSTQDEIAGTMLVQPDGRIVLAGVSHLNIAACRLSGGGARHYAVQDGNYNVTATTDATGKVVDRFQYTAYGVQTVLNADLTADLDNHPDVDQPYGFQGTRLDGNSGNNHSRWRDNRTVLGRWLQEDPARYIDGMNYYAYVLSCPVKLVDPTGLANEEEDFLTKHRGDDVAGLAIRVKGTITGDLLGNGKVRPCPMRPIRANQEAGIRRQNEQTANLQKEYPKGTVQNETYLRNPDGTRAVDKETGEMRRLDHVVVQEGKAAATVETTSPTAPKTAQMAKEARIRDAGGVFIRDRSTGQLIPVPLSAIRRLPIIGIIVLPFCDNVASASASPQAQVGRGGGSGSRKFLKHPN